MATGMGYVEAYKAYEAMSELFARAVRESAKICVGRVLSLSPVIREPMVVNMRFTRTKAGLKPSHRQYFLGRRLGLKVSIYKEFLAKNRLSIQ